MANVSDEDILGSLYDEEKPKKSSSTQTQKQKEFEYLPTGEPLDIGGFGEIPKPENRGYRGETAGLGFFEKSEIPEPNYKVTRLEEPLLSNRMQASNRGYRQETESLDTLDMALIDQADAERAKQELESRELEQRMAERKQEAALKVQLAEKEAAISLNKEELKNRASYEAARKKGELGLALKKEGIALSTEKQLADYNASKAIQEKALVARANERKGFNIFNPLANIPEPFGREADARKLGISGEQYRLIKERAEAGVPFEHSIGYYDKKGNLRYKREAITPTSIAMQVAELKKKEVDIQKGRQDIEIKRQEARNIASGIAARDTRTYAAQTAYPGGFGVSGSEGPYRRSKGVRFGSTNFGQTPIYISGHDGGKLRNKYVLGGIPGVAYALAKGREGASRMGARVFDMGSGDMLRGPPTNLRMRIGASEGNANILSKLGVATSKSNVLAKLSGIKPRLRP